MHRINISVPDDLAKALKETPVKVSKICQEALRKALLEEYARREQAKVLSMLEN